MKKLIIFKLSTQFTSACCVILLTLLTSNCAYLQERYGEECKSRAYIHAGLPEFISQRFHRNSPVRLAIIPFSVPANLSTQNLNTPGLDQLLAWDVQLELVSSQALPIVEVLNRPDWPGKKEEFFTGNFGAIAQAKEAAYDLVLVGYLEPMRSVDQMLAYSKIIEVESGITIWSGRSTVYTRRYEMDQVGNFIGLEEERPDRVYIGAMTHDMAKCIVKGINSLPN